VAGLAALLGDALVTQAGKDVATAEALAGKEYLMVYCSAHWCPPCRAFTPDLAAWVARHGERLKLGFVFASRDRDAKQFSDYFTTMAPGSLALPFGDGGADEIMKKFRVSGIPTLLVFDASGHLLSKSGRDGVAKDPEATAFPWAAGAGGGGGEAEGGGGCTLA